MPYSDSSLDLQRHSVGEATKRPTPLQLPVKYVDGEAPCSSVSRNAYDYNAVLTKDRKVGDNIETQAEIRSPEEFTTAIKPQRTFRPEIKDCHGSRLPERNAIWKDDLAWSNAFLCLLPLQRAIDADGGNARPARIGDVDNAGRICC